MKQQAIKQISDDESELLLGNDSLGTDEEDDDDDDDEGTDSNELDELADEEEKENAE